MPLPTKSTRPRSKPPLLRHIWPLSWALVILVLHGISGNSLPKLQLLDALKPDKLVHITLFWILSHLWLASLNREGRIPNRKNKALVLIGCITYGFCLECSQFYIFEGRSFDLWDWLADTLGAMLALVFFSRLHSSIINRLQNGAKKD